MGNYSDDSGDEFEFGQEDTSSSNDDDHDHDDSSGSDDDVASVSNDNDDSIISLDVGENFNPNNNAATTVATKNRKRSNNSTTTREVSNKKNMTKSSIESSSTIRQPPRAKIKTIEETYQKKSQLEHILLRPDTYIGSVEPLTQPMFVLDDGDDGDDYDTVGRRIIQREITFTPGFYKIFDEIVVNAADNKQRDPTMDRLEIDVDAERGMISVLNNGKSIPVVKHKEHGCYVATLIFGHLLTVRLSVLLLSFVDAFSFLIWESLFHSHLHLVLRYAAHSRVPTLMMKKRKRPEAETDMVQN